MKHFRFALVIVVAVSLNCYAQRGGARGGGGFHGGGATVHSGGGGFHAGGNGFHAVGGGFRGGGGYHGGYGYHGRGYGGYGYGRYRYAYGWPVYYGYGWPWYGGYYDGYGGYPYTSEPAYAPSSDYYDSSGAPPVVISQSFYTGDSGAPMAYGPPPPPPAPEPPQQPEPAPTAAQSQAPVMYLIALNTHTIYPALAYWVDHGMVHYLDLEHRQKSVPLSSVDREFSEQLNRERHVPFSLKG